MKNDKQMLQAVEERKQRARDLKVVDNLFTLYQDHLKSLKDGSEHEEHIPKKVAVTVCSQPKAIYFALSDKPYEVSYSEYRSWAPDSDDSYGTLSLKHDGKLVLELKCLGERDSSFYMTWRVLDVEAFIEGDWVEEFNRFARQVFGFSAQRRAEENKVYAQKQAEDLKRKFGL
jgi:hypothetical protein